jgi:hypothetical protein
MFMMWWTRSLIIAVILLMVPQAASAFRVGLAPSDVLADKGDTVVVEVFVDPEGETINLIDATVQWHPSQLSVVEVHRFDSGLPLWLIDPVPDARGEVRFLAGAPNPGLSERTKLADIVVALRSDDTAIIGIGATTTGYLNDGLGTPRYPSTPSTTRFQKDQKHIVQTKEKVFVGDDIQVPQDLDAPGPAQQPFPSVPVVTSSSHPDSIRWTSLSQVDVSWIPIPGAVYSYLATRERDTLPDTVPEGTESSAAVTLENDGVSYVHVRAGREGRWGDAAHYEVRVDTSAPEPFLVQLVPPRSDGRNHYSLIFAARDRTSGVVAYRVKEGQRVVTTFDYAYILQRQTPGTFPVDVTAIDRAGNERTVHVRVTIPGAVIKLQPGVPQAAIFIVIGLGAAILYRSHRDESSISSVQR